MITKRTLKKWRKEALEDITTQGLYDPDDSTNLVEGSKVIELNKRILRMTQILLNQHLMRKK